MTTRPESTALRFVAAALLSCAVGLWGCSDSNIRRIVEPEDPTPLPEEPTPEDPTPEDPTPEDPTPEDPTPEDPTPIEDPPFEYEDCTEFAIPDPITVPTNSACSGMPDMELGDPLICVNECPEHVLVVLPVQNTGLATASNFNVTLFSSDGDVETWQLDTTVGTLESGVGIVLSPFWVTEEEWGPDVMVSRLDSEQFVSECDEQYLHMIEIGPWPCQFVE